MRLTATTLTPIFEVYGVIDAISGTINITIYMSDQLNTMLVNNTTVTAM